MKKTKKICAYCGDHLKGSPSALQIFHGCCRTCKDAMRRAIAGERVEMRFWDRGDRTNQAVLPLADVSGRVIEMQTIQGRTEREIVNLNE